MGKRRKTRQEKIISDLRRQLQPTDQLLSSPGQNQSYQIESPVKKELQKPAFQYTQPTTTALETYPHHIKDLQKTAVLTGILILLELFLIFLFKNHTIQIPGLSY